MEQQKELTYLNPSEVSTLLDGIPRTRDKVLLSLLYELGCSLRELVNIRVRDVSFEEHGIAIPGSHTKRCERFCLVSSRTLDLLRSYLDEENLLKKRLSYIFSSSHGGHMTVRRITQLIHNILNDAGFEDRANPQVLKYSHIINAYQANVPISAIQKQVGLTKHRLVSILLEVDTEAGIEHYEKFLAHE
ncbi:MAG: tyrosine-type recombinase/integrase [Candidatus Woesearchaeota archaeon]